MVAGVRDLEAGGEPAYGGDAQAGLPSGEHPQLPQRGTEDRPPGLGGLGPRVEDTPVGSAGRRAGRRSGWPHRPVPAPGPGRGVPGPSTWPVSPLRPSPRPSRPSLIRSARIGSPHDGLVARHPRDQACREARCALARPRLQRLHPPPRLGGGLFPYAGRALASGLPACARAARTMSSARRAAARRRASASRTAAERMRSASVSSSCVSKGSSSAVRSADRSAGTPPGAASALAAVPPSHVTKGRKPLQGCSPQGGGRSALSSPTRRRDGENTAAVVCAQSGRQPCMTETHENAVPRRRRQGGACRRSPQRRPKSSTRT